MIEAPHTGASEGANKEPWAILLRYWQSKHIAGRPPSRADIDPLIDIPVLLPNLMLIDIVPDGFEYRLVGSDIVARYGIDLTRRRVGISKIEPNVRDKWVSIMGTITNDQQPRLLLSGGPHMLARHVRLLMPLVDKTGKTEMIFAGLFREGDSKDAMITMDLKIETIDQRLKMD